ncbi:ubiquinone biosynthesis protein [Phenylobacterium montanum]|uniref:Ubiquinone biosynthesis protein n=2 Tax=Phenylobacterium montanum TaxID=2823693 RepID=A0A975G546_9CAUL|nr:ubiquinone biosynthesis protein [Caulobacter sp. S6]
MTQTIEAAPAADFASPRQGRQWGVALRALNRLMADKEDTGQVFEIMRALNAGSAARGYHRLIETREGGRMAYERTELAGRLMDDAWLDSFAPGTVGAAYRDFVRSENLSAEGLAEVSRQNRSREEERHPYAWFGRRTRDVHDIWHILTGYHRDGLGEACLVAFSYAQTKGLGWAAIALSAALRPGRGRRGPYVAAIWQGYRRGKAAAWLLGEDYERLLNEPLEAARRRLNITPATRYDAIPVAQRDFVPAV